MPSPITTPVAKDIAPNPFKEADSRPERNNNNISPSSSQPLLNNLSSLPPSSGNHTNNNTNGAETGSERLRWHSRSESHASSSNEDGSRFEVPTTTEGPRYQLPSEVTVSQRKYLVVMVGLPARGKTFISQKLCRMLAWLGLGAVVHNVQVTYKQSLHPPRRLELDDFDFRNKNSQTFANYMKALDKTAEQVKAFFQERNGLVAFVNDDFVNKDLREEVEKRIGCYADQTIYVEVTRDAELNIQNDLEKIMNPKEFGVVDRERDVIGFVDAKKKFYARVELLKEQYTSVKETAKSWITLHNGKNLEACNVRGYLPSRITSVLLNLGSQKQRFPIYFSRHGESMYNLEDRIGGNPPLTDKGLKDAEYLCDFIGVLVEDNRRRQEEASISGSAEEVPDIQIWTSQLQRTIQTSQPAVDKYKLDRFTWHNLNEIHAGVCEDLTYSEVKQKYPSIDYFRSQAKYSFRYPQGESYQDIVQRLEPIILELENAEREIVVVAHQAILRALLAYFGHKSAESSVYQNVPHRTIWRCTYSADGVSYLDELKLPLSQGLPPVISPHSAAVASGHHHQHQSSSSTPQSKMLPSEYHSGMSLDAVGASPNKTTSFEAISPTSGENNKPL
jgi:broad specificity phosphatase PhoE